MTRRCSLRFWRDPLNAKPGQSGRVHRLLMHQFSRCRHAKLSNANGVSASSPGLVAGTTYVGIRAIEAWEPHRGSGAEFPMTSICYCRNPVGVESLILHRPRVDRGGGQPWAMCCATFGGFNWLCRRRRGHLSICAAPPDLCASWPQSKFKIAARHNDWACCLIAPLPAL